MEDHYGTLAGADAYQQSTGGTVWDGLSDPDKTAALVRASAYIDSLSGQLSGTGCVLRFPGKKTGGRAQVLAWPRTGAVDSEGDKIDPDSVPVEIERAVYAAALYEAETPGFFNPSFVSSGLVKKSKVGPIEEEFAISQGGGNAQDVIPVIPVIQGVMSGLLYCAPDIPVVFTA